MNHNNRVVYSTEHGQLSKVMEPAKKHKKNNKNKSSTSNLIKNPNKQGVRIHRESKGRGGKNVCVIDGLPLGEKALKNLLKKLKGNLGCGGTVKGHQLEIQGDHRDKLLILLKAEGYKAKLSGG